MEYTKLLYKILISGKRINKKISKITIDNYPNIYNFIMNIFDDSDSIYETIKRLQLNIINKPKCLCCNKPVKFIGVKGRILLKSCGNSDCSKFINQLHCKQTCLEKYGVDNPAKSILIKEKTKQTCLEKYGKVTPLLNNDIKEKTKHTNITRYGLEKPQRLDYIKEKIAASNKSTCISKYGVDNVSKLQNITQKRKETCNLKYNSDNIMQSDYIKLQLSNISEKRNITKQHNNSFNKSKPENDCYEMLKEKYPGIIRQYRDKRYPFSCDFYIPSKDLFIEYQGSQFHQGHPFDINNEKDITILNILREKSNNSNRKKQGKKTQYDNIIYTWTDLDVRKRNIAKENKLNYIEFWNLNEVKLWLQMN